MIFLNPKLPAEWVTIKEVKLENSADCAVKVNLGIIVADSTSSKPNWTLLELNVVDTF